MEGHLLLVSTQAMLVPMHTDCKDARSLLVKGILRKNLAFSRKSGYVVSVEPCLSPVSRPDCDLEEEAREWLAVCKGTLMIGPAQWLSCES